MYVLVPKTNKWCNDDLQSKQYYPSRKGYDKKQGVDEVWFEFTNKNIEIIKQIRRLNTLGGFVVNIILRTI